MRVHARLDLLELEVLVELALLSEGVRLVDFSGVGQFAVDLAGCEHQSRGATYSTAKVGLPSNYGPRRPRTS